MKTTIGQLLKVTKTSETSDISQSTLSKLNKDVMAKYMQSLVNLFESNLDLCKSAATEIDKLKSEQISNQKHLLKLQQTQMGNVHETVKTEIKTFAEIVEKNCKPSNPISAKSVK